MKVKIVKRMGLNLKEKYTDAGYYEKTKSMSINLKLCAICAKTDGIDFYELVARCINHEFLHHLLWHEQDNNVTIAFDNIAERYEEYWMW